MLKLVVLLMLVSLLVFFLSALIDKLIMKHRATVYISRFAEIYQRTNDIKGAMIILSRHYKKNSFEKIAIQKGIFYLENSIFRDYQTALSFISSVFKDKRVIAFHEDLLYEEKQKMRFLLPVKED